MTVINTNVKSLVAQDAIMKNNRSLSTSMQRLSTGSRINSAKDDAAGLAISTRMDSQVRGLNMAIRNANDGISLMQTAEGAMDEVTGILQRMRELSVQSVNGTNNDSDRVALNDEVTQLKSELERIATTTEFNSQKILDGSFKDKKLQIGDKSYQTMDVNIESIKLKDLGMTPGVGTSADMLVGQRFNSAGSFQAGDVRINDQALAAFDGATQDIGDLVTNINQNVDNVNASAFNTVVAKQVGTGVTTDGQFKVKVLSLGASAATEYSISASNSLDELVANINTQAGGQVTASVNDAGKLVLSNETGATISVKDGTGTAAGYETASGFVSGATYTDYAGFLSLESKDGSPIRIERGNLDKTAPGNLADLQVLGFREVTSQFNNAQDAYTVTGDALTSAGAASAWALGDLKVNGVDIYDKDIATTSFQGKLDAINNFSEQTGVIAYAAMDKTFSMSASDLNVSSGSTIVINGVTASVTVAVGSAATMAEITTAINSITAKTGITAAFNGGNLKLTGTNTQSMTIETRQSAGTATAMLGFTGVSNTYFGSIRLDSAKNQPISIETATGATAGAIGLYEQNVGASDFDVNAPQLGVASGTSLSGLNISSANSATKAIAVIDQAIETVSSNRSKLGAMENRLNNTVNNLSNIVTNTQASRSRIQDTDYASETTQLAKAQIISQAATAMLAQANQQPQSVLSLLK
jgi:flagellin